MQKIVLAMSGGMDSVLVYAKAKELGCDIITVGFFYNSRHNKRECEDLEFIYRKFGPPADLLTFTLDMDFVALQTGLLKAPLSLEDSPSLVVPGRNLLMITYLVMVAMVKDADTIAMGMCEDDRAGFPDCRPGFIYHTEMAIQHMTENKITLWTPLLHQAKKSIVLEGNLLGIPWERTYSCYTGRELHCGKCHACRTRRKGFENAGVVDPTQYENGE